MELPKQIRSNNPFSYHRDNRAPSYIYGGLGKFSENVVLFSVGFGQNRDNLLSFVWLRQSIGVTIKHTYGQHTTRRISCSLRLLGRLLRKRPCASRYV